MIIGLYGPQGVGKTTLASQIRCMGYNVESFAKPIKEMAKPVIDAMRIQTGKEDIDPDLGFSPRQLYQVLGTEVGRHLSTDLWVDLMALRTEDMARVVIDDCRFDNERTWIESQGGKMVYVCSQIRVQEQADGHSSEQDWHNWWGNDGIELYLNNGDHLQDTGNDFRLWVRRNLHDT